MPKEMRSLNDRPNRLWANPSLFGFSLLTLFLDRFGPEALAWAPETIDLEIREETGVDLPAASYSRLMAAISILTGDAFFRSAADFAQFCVILSGHTPRADSLLLPDCADIAWGITEGLLIHPPEGDRPFDREITAFVGQCLDDEGILTPPDVLRIGLRDRDLLDHARYDYADDPDMFAMIQQFESDKTGAINHLVLGRTRALLGQLRELPVAGGRAAALAEKLLAKLPGDEDLPLPA